MKEIAERLGAVGATRLPGWGQRDPYCAWLDTLQDMAANRCQWRSCCQFLSRLPDYEPCAIGTVVPTATTSITGKRENGIYNQTLEADAQFIRK
ncbi:hypothetical protein T265_09361 [Opisthorchis viverrini]|uniref:Uncharacterized protein n=1 Tax=Opisthorchis viverrini TaxID=6198 RepID=A0A074ZAJ8_OPIVI|nr:hypothetical protein T265_09361 [Opisthorchis viverrini]KER22597.1 hypothetical protein T265_09361 [Opisthorchis viverrini]